MTMVKEGGIPRTETGGRPGSRDTSFAKARVVIITARAGALIGLLVLWQVLVSAGVADEAFVSTPPSVLDATWSLLGTAELWDHFRTTLTEILIAFALSTVLGVATAIFLDRNGWVHSVVAPFLAAFNSMPRIALGPLFILWFGIGINSKVVLATSLGFFIILLATMGGLKNVDRDMLLMSRLYGASERRLFWYVRLPWALPGLFAGLRLALVYCTAGAVIGEMIAAQSGLGLLLQTYSSQFNIANVFAVLLVLMVLVSLLTGIIEVVERRLLRWSAGSTDVPG